MTRTAAAVERRVPAREAILDAALRLASSRGGDGFTMLDIARAAGVSHTTVYNHVESRQHVLEILAARWTNDALDAAHRAALGCEPDDVPLRLRTLILTLCRLKCDLLAGEPHLFAAFAQAMDGTPMARAAYLDRLRGMIERMLIDGRAGGPDPAGLARAILLVSAKFRHAAFIRSQGYAALSDQLDVVLTHLIGPVLTRAAPQP